MKKPFFLIFILFAFMYLRAQDTIDFNNYKPLKCKGVIPGDFKTELSGMINEVKSGAQAGNKGQQKQQIEFAEITNYGLNNILYSGKVLYGDRLTEYVNTVADNVLKKEPELRKKLRFYILKNTSPNAMTLQMGVIFFNIGLLAQIETEAQLAYIICHEAVHFRNKHSMGKYIRRQELVTGRNRYMNDDDKLKNLMSYSKDHELEADREGLELFLSSDYNSKDLNSLFDVMLYSYLPFDEIAFRPSYFATDSLYSLPRTYFLKEVKNITARADVPDSMSTHPNIQKRRSAILAQLENSTAGGGLSYIASKEEFNTVQRAARCELAIAHMEEGEYEQAFYAAFLLERKYGKTLFSDKILCGSMYAISKQKSYYESLSRKRKLDKEFEYLGTDRTFNFWETVEGESQAVFYFFYQIPSRDLSVLAARKLYECGKIYNDVYFQLRFKSLVNDLITIHMMSRDVFIKEPSLLEETNGTKVSRIRNTTEKPPKYYHYAFVPFYSDSFFRESFLFWEVTREQEEKRKADLNYAEYTYKKTKLLNKYGEGLDVSKFVLINPHYSNIVFRYIYFDTFYYAYRIKNPQFRPLEEVEIENKLISYTRKYAEELKLEVDVIGGNQTVNIQTERFNDFQQMINWSSERISMGEMNALTYHDQYMQPYAATYGYLGFFYVANVYQTLEVHFVLFDLSTGETKLVYSQELKRAKGDSVQVRMMIYDILHKIKQDPERINQLKKQYGIGE
jgi:hypothetical protein